MCPAVASACGCGRALDDDGWPHARLPTADTPCTIEAPALPHFTPYPPGWREVLDPVDGVVTCEP